MFTEEGEELAQPSKGTAYDKLEASLLAKIEELQGKIGKTEDATELQKLSGALSQLLDSLDRVQKMKKTK